MGTPVPLHYLLFDAADDDSGGCSFDALASALPAQWPALQAEVAAVLGWARRGFGAPGGDGENGDEGEWRFDLQAFDAHDAALPLAWDATGTEPRLARPPTGRITLALTLGGSAAFGDAFRDAFPAED